MSAPIRAKVQVEADDATRDLWLLAETDDTERLEDILARGADINASNDDGVTALVRAAYNGRVRMVRALIDHGADLNARREDGFTPLGLAAFFGHTDVVRVLVERGADLGKATPFGTSAEMWATARSFYEIARYLEQARSGGDELGVTPSVPESEPDDQLVTALPFSAGPPTPGTSDLTLETPPVIVSAPSILQRLEENPGTGQENEHAPAERVIVRTLKNPPEIWDLVHETPPYFNPGGAFVARLTSSKTNLVLLTLGVIFFSGLAFAIITLRGGRTPVGTAPQVQEERGAPQTVTASQADAQASAPVNAELNTSPGTANGLNNTPPRPSDPQPTDPHADNPASTAPAFTSSIQRTGMTINNISKRIGSFAGTTAALSRNKRVTVASGRQNADKPRPAGGESETIVSHDTTAKPETPQRVEVKNSGQKISSDSASAEKRSNTTLSPQLIAPPPTNSAPKAKVIRWP